MDMCPRIDRSTFFAQVLDAATRDSGNYSCIPSYADPANITVHVLNGNLFLHLFRFMSHKHVSEEVKKKKLR